MKLILATTPTGIIGDSSGLLWHLPEDMRHFRVSTTGHIVIMGRKTYETLGRPLPNRINIILTRNPARYSNSNSAVIYTDLEHLDSVIGAHPTVFVIGGKEIYELLVERAKSVYLTTVYWTPNEESGLVSLSPEFMAKITKEFGRETIIQPRTNSKSGLEYRIVLLDNI